MATATAKQSVPGEASVHPETTKSIVLVGFGGYDKLKILPKPFPKDPGPGELVIHVRAAGINFADLMARQGLYNRIPDLPTVCGLEASGDVYKVGSDVKDFKLGDRVMCVKMFGAWSEYILVLADHCCLIPDAMSYDEAAAVPVNYVTAYHILFDFGNLRPNQSVLIHMAAGGVGMAATQLCRTVPNVTVFGTASLGKHGIIQQNGVDHPINYRSVDYVQEVRKVDPQGVDIVMDPLSGADSVKGFDLLKPLGKIIHFGAANAVSGAAKSYWSLAKSYFATKSYNSMALITTNKAVCGYHMGELPPPVVKSALVKLIDLAKEGKIKPHIDSVWAFEDIGLAMARLHERANIGKVIISPQKDPQYSTK